MLSTRPRFPMAAWWAGGIACAAAALVACQGPRLMAGEDQSEGKKESKAASQTQHAAKSVDDALLDDLDNELLGGVGDLKKRPRANAPEGQPAGKTATAPPDGEDVGTPSAEHDPLGHISQQMRRAERLIPERSKRADTEQVQRKIVDDLARLIDQVEQQRAQQQSSKKSKQQASGKRQRVRQPKSSSANQAGKNSDKPAADSTDRLGQAEAARPDPELFKGLLKDSWGNLPERERELMMQMSRERFLPQYELLIERYYRRLAEERSK
jgi:hypothetical protein